ncbi:DUF1850 domain-containing protein [Bacillus xiapuensis]|uniref:DUF1850 domain-containing protein n=1 Tax=Bacillus xiapuensis TaxID=2014075 RepID=UPI001E62FCCE|nr:DUF1850 domain-containing protein [Bacillus xiapuensis]
MNSRKKAVPLIFLFLAAACWLFIPSKPAVVFTFENTDQWLAYMPLQKTNTFQIQYTHSIHLTEVIETYQIEQEQFVQKELQYERFAIGMPAGAEGKERFVEKDGKYYITGMQRKLPWIDMRIGQVKANHRMNYKGRTHPLSDCLSPGMWVRVQFKRLSLWQQWKGVNLNEPCV